MNALNKYFSLKIMLLRGDTLALDRWRFVRAFLQKTNNKEKILDIGCGNGSFCLNAAALGYNCLGLTWDKKDENNANIKAKNLDIKSCQFGIQDVRQLGNQKELKNKFDFIICTENAEHIIDDLKLFKDMNSCLANGGILIFTAPNYFYTPISKGDMGPFRKVEDGGHVRKGYTAQMLSELCELSNFKVEKISYCGGFLSQKITAIYRFFSKINSKLAWLIILPLRIFPPTIDSLLNKIIARPMYSISLIAYKPRFK
jgi:2-polyprenyl-3-methyl-5-hydroxy-6-metoxy-1,4-benzoquinol methylase